MTKFLFLFESGSYIALAGLVLNMWAWLALNILPQLLHYAQLWLIFILVFITAHSTSPFQVVLNVLFCLRMRVSWKKSHWCHYAQIVLREADDKLNQSHQSAHSHNDTNRRGAVK